eukprot:scaffold8399_cov179-Ochromonas_danica.AAC.2
MSQVLRRHLWPSSSSSKSKKAVNTLEESKAVLSKSLSFMEHKLEAASPEQKFLASKTHPTIADLLILPELDQQNLSACNLVDYSYFPKVQQWMENAKSSIQCYEEVFAPLNKRTSQTPELQKHETSKLGWCSPFSSVPRVISSLTTERPKTEEEHRHHATARTTE